MSRLNNIQDMERKLPDFTLVMQSRPKPKLDKNQLNTYSTLKTYQLKTEKHSNLPKMHIPFRVRRNQLTRDNSKFLYKVIQKSEFS